MAENVKGNKNRFHKYVNSKRNTRENLDLILNASGKMLTKHVYKAKTLNAFFLQPWLVRSAFWNPKTPETRDQVWGKEDLTSMSEDQATKHFAKLSVCKSVGLDELHPCVLSLLSDVFLRPPSYL